MFFSLLFVHTIRIFTHLVINQAEFSFQMINYELFIGAILSYTLTVITKHS
jgi:hypothetical protein